MSLVTHPFSMWMRGALRRIGLTRPLALLMARGGYEEPVDKALFGLIRPGDVVWDVGANVGLYTVKFASAVGNAGVVCAFEPSSQNLQQLRSATEGHDNVLIVPIGLSAAPGRFSFVQGADDLGATSKIAETGDFGATEEVELKRGDDVIRAGGVPTPAIVKIDVEGHEHKVIRGLAETLKNPFLRALVIEVHFRLLKESGHADAPKRIEKTLGDNGFSVRWIDASHICATRGFAAT